MKEVREITEALEEQTVKAQGCRDEDVLQPPVFSWRGLGQGFQFFSVWGLSLRLKSSD